MGTANMDKGYLINAETRTVTPLDYNPDVMRKWLPNGIDIAWSFDNGDVIYVDGEGLLHPFDCAFRIKDRPDGQPLAGHGIVTGRDDASVIDGKFIEVTLPPEFTAEQIAERIEWLTAEQARDWFRGVRNQTSLTISNLTTGEVLHRETWGDMHPDLTAPKPPRK